MKLELRKSDKDKYELIDTAKEDEFIDWKSPIGIIGNKKDANNIIDKVNNYDTLSSLLLEINELIDKGEIKVEDKLKHRIDDTTSDIIKRELLSTMEELPD